VYKSYAQDVITALGGINQERVKEAALILQRAQFQNASVYVLGNGGSAATASHFANDLLKMCGIRAMALTDMTSTILAYGNDHGWEQMFSLPLKALLLPQDVVFAITCSGKSANVVEALHFVKNLSLPALRTILLTGSDLDSPAIQTSPNAVIYVPFRDVQVQEDCHLVVCHALSRSLAHG